MFCSDLFEVGRLLNIYKLDEKASVVMEKFKGSSEQAIQIENRRSRGYL